MRLLTSATLKFAGWLAMASAFLTLPLVYLSYRLDSRLDVTSTLIEAAIQLFGVMLFVAITRYLKKFLDALFNFHDVDRAIDLMIIANVIAGILTIIGLYFTHLKEASGYAVMVILVAQGLVQAQFGYKLLRLPYGLGGILKPFCYANIATGILIATIVLIPIGIVASALSDLMLGTIFLNTAQWIGSEGKFDRKP
jgi:hypothetical protein